MNQKQIWNLLFTQCVALLFYVLWILFFPLVVLKLFICLAKSRQTLHTWIKTFNSVFPGKSFQALSDWRTAISAPSTDVMDFTSGFPRTVSGLKPLWLSHLWRLHLKLHSVTAGCLVTARIRALLTWLPGLAVWASSRKSLKEFPKFFYFTSHSLRNASARLSPFKPHHNFIS